MSKCDVNGPWDVGFKHCEDDVLKVSTRNNNYIVSVSAVLFFVIKEKEH